MTPTDMLSVAPVGDDDAVDEQLTNSDAIWAQRYRERWPDDPTCPNDGARMRYEGFHGMTFNPPIVLASWHDNFTCVDCGHETTVERAIQPPEQKVQGLNDRA